MFCEDSEGVFSIKLGFTLLTFICFSSRGRHRKHALSSSYSQRPRRTLRLKIDVFNRHKRQFSSAHVGTPPSQCICICFGISGNHTVKLLLNCQLGAIDEHRVCKIIMWFLFFHCGISAFAEMGSMSYVTFLFINFSGLPYQFVSRNVRPEEKQTFWV